MTYFIWTFRLVFISLVLGFLHYTLPQHDIVRITGTDIIRRDFGGFNQIFYADNQNGDETVQSRDLRLISAVRRQCQCLPQRRYWLGMATLFQVWHFKYTGAGNGPDLDQKCRDDDMGFIASLWLAFRAVVDLSKCGADAGD